MIRVADVTVHAGQFRLENASLEVPTGQYGVVMGRTGSGKTTILEAIAGLKTIRHGRIFLDDRDVTLLKPAARNLGYVPQDGALFSNMNVRAHLAFALVIRRMGRKLIEQRVDEMAELLGVGPLLDRTVHGLSGGEKQRVALGRALAFHPDTLLLDEPLSALDDETRGQMYDLLKQIQRRTGVTTVHVTHSLEEAQHLADRLFRFEDGRITLVYDRRADDANVATAEAVEESKSEIENPKESKSDIRNPKSEIENPKSETNSKSE